MRYYILESGSKGNSTIIVSKGRYLVIDNGLSKKKFNDALFDINVDLANLNVVLLTHNHSDHISGISIFKPSYIYATRFTTDLVDQNHELIPYEEYELNGFKILVIPTSHDAKGSVGFVIRDEEDTLVYITDTGYLYEKAIPLLKNAQYYIFESNHDVRMQLATKRPQYLIDRIMGDQGHLSNEAAALYLSEIIGNDTKEITLAHLSQDANTPEAALATFNKIMGKRGVDVSNITVRCASQTELVSGGDITKEIIL